LEFYVPVWHKSLHYVSRIFHDVIDRICASRRELTCQTFYAPGKRFLEVASIRWVAAKAVQMANHLKGDFPYFIGGFSNHFFGVHKCEH
jgi:hypothetical protein